MGYIVGVIVVFVDVDEVVVFVVLFGGEGDVVDVVLWGIV